MCAIVGSFDTEKLKELVELNSYRGQHSHSISYYNCREKTLTITKKLGSLELADINIPEGHYGICHIQAPTTDATDINSIHPASGLFENKPTCLWHNGILKNTTVKALQKYYGTDEEWDTTLLLHRLNSAGIPENIDGTFSCLWFKPLGQGRGDLYLFRNEISPMFIDDNFNISSTKFEGSHSTDPNVILWMYMDLKLLIKKETFKTVESPYFFFQDV